MSQSIGHKAVRGSLSTGAGKLVGFLIRFVGNAALARILVPEQFGIYALALTYSEAVGLVGAFSFSQALLQLDEGRKHLVGTAFWMTVAVAVGLFVLSLALWPLLRVLQDPQIADCFLLLAAVRIPSWAGQCLVSALYRDFRFHRAAAWQVIGVLVSIALVVPAAAYFESPLVLAVRDFVPAVVLFVVLLRPILKQVGLRFDRACAREVWQLGRSLFFNRVLETTSRYLDQLMVGSFIGTQHLGFYERARWLASLPGAVIQPISGAVGLRTLSALRQERARLSRAFDLSQFVIFRLLLGMGIVVMVVPDIMVRLALGPGWEEAGHLLGLSGPWLILGGLNGNYRVVLFAVREFGQVNRLLVWGVGLSAVAAPLTLVMGASGMILANTLSAALMVVLSERALREHVDRGERTYLPAVVAGAVAVSAGHLARLPLGEAHLAVQAVVGLGVPAVCFTSVSLLLEGRRLRAELRYLATKVFRQRRPD